MAARKTKVGVVGCGNISGTYLKNATQLFKALEVVACADLIMSRAEAKAQEFGVPRACSTEELLAIPEVEIVLNITNPAAHAEVALAAIEAGKNVHGEKPLAVSREDGRRILKAARAKGVRVGGAPDTFMGAGIQTCCKLIDDGAIGQPVSCTANMLSHGPENWHPSPEFFYKFGGGPLFDMGPYYLTALVSLLGPVKRVAGLTAIGSPERLITSQPLYGTRVKVEVPTHAIGLLEFASGTIGTITMSFDTWAAHAPRIEIYGTDGSLAVPDPNTFGGPVCLWTTESREWREVPLTHSYTENSRGLGMADMAMALRSGRPHRASGDLAFHVLDIMQTIHEAPAKGRYQTLKSTCERPAPLPMGLKPGTLDA